MSKVRKPAGRRAPFPLGLAAVLCFTAGLGIAMGPDLIPSLNEVPAIQDLVGECSIKGNISDSGERVYHVPGQKYYARTRVDTHRGEKWFCSEAEAAAAGWRRARI